MMGAIIGKAGFAHPTCLLIVEPTEEQEEQHPAEYTDAEIEGNVGNHGITPRSGGSTRAASSHRVPGSDRVERYGISLSTIQNTLSCQRFRPHQCSDQHTPPHHTPQQPTDP